uniref:Torsin-1A C-terminal domain-containing protein n=1 Tax=Trichobilharzia regenti TaxID=157069 RepID=A0AA85KHW1_TRIRE|nr:unnamed protein product [Trichobilharzia regenti]
MKYGSTGSTENEGLSNRLKPWIWGHEVIQYIILWILWFYATNLTGGYINIHRVVKEILLSFLGIPEKCVTQERLYRELHAAVSECPTSIFVFDEMHNMPHGILDVLAPLLEIRESVEGVDFRRSVFLFLSNAGGNYINRRTYEHLVSGKKREDLRYTDIDRVLAKSAFNNEGGLQYSELITKHLITAVVPFLPLQPTHVRDCIKDVAKKRNVTFSEDMVQFVLDELEWAPEGSKFFSVSGCKRVYEKVGFYIQQL